MPAPSADFIRSMLQPYQPYGSSGAIALAGLQENRNQRREGARQFDVEDARKKQYYGFQREQWETGREDEMKQRQMDAFMKFQDALDRGDEEGAALWANALRAWGVNVDEMGGGGAGGTGGGTAPGVPSGPGTGPEQTPESYDPGNTYGSPPAATPPAAASGFQGPPSAQREGRFPGERTGADLAREFHESQREAGEDYYPGRTSTREMVRQFRQEDTDAIIEEWERNPSSDPVEQAAREKWIAQAKKRKGDRVAGRGRLAEQRRFEAQMGALPQSPTAIVDQARAQAQFAPQATDDYNPEADADEQQADALIKQWETEPASSPEEEQARQEYIFNANAAKARRMEGQQPQQPPMAPIPPGLQPGPSMPGGLPSPAPSPIPPVEQSGGEGSAGAIVEPPPPPGPRPGPAREGPAMAEPPAPGGQRMPMLGGYRLTIGGKVINIDGHAIAERQRNRVRGIMSTLVTNANTPEEKEAAQEAMDIAINSVGIYSPAEAVQNGLKHYSGRMDIAAREQRARIGAAGQAARGGVASGNKFELARTSGLTDDVENMVKGVEQNWGVKNLREASAASDKTVDLLSTQNPLAQRAALTATLKQWFSSVTSNTELAMVLGGGGFIEQMKLEIGKYLDEGRLPEKYVRWLKEASVKAAAWSRKRIADAAETARRTILENPGFTERFTKPGEGQRYADYVWGRITGTRIKRKPAGAAAPAKPAGKKGAPRTNVQAEADELAR